MDPKDGAADSGFDMDSAVSDIAGGLGIDISDEPEAPDEDIDLDLESQLDGDEDEAESTEVAAEPEAAAAAPVVREMPKSWSKDKAELWAKMAPDAQEYYTLREKQMLDGLEQYKTDATWAKELRSVTEPYRAFLTSQGATEKQAVGMLLNAHYRMTNGSMEERQAAYRQIGVELGFHKPEAPTGVAADPVVQNLQKQLESVKSTLTASQKAEETRIQQEADREIEAFAADPKHVYFGEVGQDMVALLRSGLSLADAYDKAVWANPVTRQKELNRAQTETAEKLKADAKKVGNAARQTTKQNVRGAESRKAPTEPKGEMFADMEATLAAIRKRSH